MVTSTAKSTSKQTIKGSKQYARPFNRQAKLLASQIAAREQGRQNLQLQLDNAKSRNRATRRSIVADLLAGFRSSQEGYNRAEEDATSNLGEVTNASRLNRAREGSNAMAELSNLQAGETDRIKGMAASLRAMKANLDGGANDYQAAITGINNSLGDLNISTQTNINNALREQNSSDAQAFAEWSAGNQQAYADLVDLYGQLGTTREQQAETRADKISTIKASETSSSNTTGTSTSVKSNSTQTDKLKYGKAGRKLLKAAKGSFQGSANAATQLAAQMGQTFTDPIPTIADMNAQETDPNMRFAAAALRQNQSNLDELANAGTLRKLAGPEGSQLRKRVVA